MSSNSPVAGGSMVAPARSDWLVCGVIAPTSLILPHLPFSVGMFEISRQVDSLPGCEQALRESAAALGEAVDLSKSFLLKTFFVGADDERTAVRSARLHAREALVLFRTTMPFPVSLALMRCGYAVNLRTLQTSPIKPSKREYALKLFGVAAVLDEVETHPTSVVNRLLSVRQDREAELGAALRRSTHWSSLAAELEDEGERFLVQWMACETLTRVDESESLTPKLCAALCLPSSRYLMQLPIPERDALIGLDEYKKWRRIFNDLFDRLRDARNRIAHTGFRELELVQALGDKDFELARRVLPMVIGRLQNLALAGLALGRTTIAELWDSYAASALLYRHITIADEVKKTIVFSLENPDPFDD